MSETFRATRMTSGVSRRNLLRTTAGALLAGAVMGPTQAFSSAEWGQGFDTTLRAARMPDSRTALLSPNSVQLTEQAIARYAILEQQGGWPAVPGTARLQLGATHPDVVALRQRLIVSGDIDPSAGASDVYDSYVESAVKRFQARHGLIVTGVVAEATVNALNVPVSVRRAQLEINRERLGELSRSGPERFVMVNIPAAEIEAVENGAIANRYTAVVGKADRPSPEITVPILEVNFNPYWTVPASIVKRDLIPLMQSDPQYLTKNRIRIFTQSGTELDPQSVNWNSDEATNYMFRQDPGGDVNSLGYVRIGMPNKDSVYMHDTPSRNLFGENFRFHSSGCVRVQNVRDLVTWLLEPNGEGWTRQRVDEVIRSGERIDARLRQPTPTRWVYVTAWAGDDGVVHFREDIYNKDDIALTAYR